MDCVSPYYDHSTNTFCGIPRIRLLGTVEDWRTLTRSAAALAEPFDEHLGMYFRYLLPVLAKIAEQADEANPVDQAFWRSIYAFKSQSGGSTVTGWSTALVHYVKRPSGKLGPKNGAEADWTQLTAGRGLPYGAFPAHVSTVPFLWTYLGDELPMKLAGGVLSVEEVDGFLTPMLSWAVLRVGVPTQVVETPEVAPESPAPLSWWAWIRGLLG